mmetsp:Transcript_19252/g.28482  ORF Transcript_19252/g.28482 Transcript_19252/m.28482 type:complete len:859 (-) Transcript_19252:25-2601(-)
MPIKRGRKGKQGNSKESAPEAVSSVSSTVESTSVVSSSTPKDCLVLTSDQRRGVYECDYCHSDISQVPRIRCAVCPDFDLCLHCFATTDHSAAIDRFKAAATAHGAIQEGPTPGISDSAANHDVCHRYIVADSTRYPLFPSSRVMSKELGSEVTLVDENGENNEANEEDKQKEDEAKGDSTQDEVKHGSKQDEAKDDSKKDEAKDDSKKSEVNESDNSSAKKGEGGDDSEIGFMVQDDSKNAWTAEEDLRLLSAISTCGLGNWADISEAISGQGSTAKTPKRCMERYFDDFLGRYGHIVPSYTIVEDDDENDNINSGDDDNGENEPKKRRLERMSSLGVAALTSGNKRGRKVKVIPTSTIPGYNDLWPDPYVPPIALAQVGQEVGRDQRYRAEQLFVKLIGNAETKEEVHRITKEWEETRLNQPNGPTALPMRTEDLPSLPGSELAGFMPRRVDFDVEWDNDAENILADMEFSANDLPQDRELKIKVINIYNSKLDEREKRKKFMLSRDLLDYRKNQQKDAKLPRDERDLVRRMRLFERFHTPEEHEQFLADILKAKRLRKEIAQLQMYRRIGIQTIAEAEKYEINKKRREIHKMAQIKKDAGTEKTVLAKMPSNKDSTPAQAVNDNDAKDSLWKEYRKTDRSKRRSINRTAPNSTSEQEPVIPEVSVESEQVQTGNQDNPEKTQEIASKSETTGNERESQDAVEQQNEGKEKATTENVSSDSMDVDKPDDSNGDSMDVDKLDDSKHISEESKEKTTNEGKEDKNFSIAGMTGYDLLADKEVDLCEKLRLKPSQYLRAKKAIIQESFRQGLLDKESSSIRTITMIDVSKRGDVVDFIARAGWISSKNGGSMHLANSTT